MNAKKLSFERMVAIEAGGFTAGCAVMGGITVVTGVAMFFSFGTAAPLFLGALGGSAAMGCFESE